MAGRQQGESPAQARPGDILVVIHAFEARSQDELSFSKGDRIELIERDDDFGDGWYLGKHVNDGRTGLFPEVYTKLSPPAPSAANQVRTTRASSTPNAPSGLVTSPKPQSSVGALDGYAGEPQSEAEKERRPSETSNIQPVVPHSAYQAAPSPLNPTSPSQRTVSVPNSFPSPGASSAPPTQRSISLMMEGGRQPEEGSPVLNETLSVIDEHITDMNTPRSSLFANDVRHFNDSGSEYSGHPGQRMSYINGNETDEEERVAYSQAEVSRWNADEVAEALEEIGVERRHCEIFREQEISGEVLLNLDQASIFVKEFDLGVVGRRLRTWQKIKSFQDEVKYDKSPPTQRHGTKGALSAALNGRHVQAGSPLAESFTADSTKSFGATTDGAKSISSRHSKTGSRDQGHSRRLSSFDAQPKPMLQADQTQSQASASTHIKKPSLDRNWTMGSQGSPVTTRSSFLGVATNSQTPSTVDLEGSTDGRDLDRGYLSGSEVDGRKHRKLIRKREASSASHSRQSSYKDLTIPPTTTKRHSRFGSAGSFIASLTSGGKSQDDSAAQKPAPTDPKDAYMFGDSPVVTRLDYDSSTNTTNANKQRQSKQTDSSQSSLAQAATRTPTDQLAVRNEEKTASISPTLVSSPLRDSGGKEGTVQPPSRTDSNATSGGNKSLEVDQSKTKIFPSGMTPTSSTRRVKNKKQTSAYTRGLLKKTPREAMAQCDYSGWMKKKSPSLIATWKPRLFVLQGRRLSYYYSENDTEEQGLIDISNHKVLAADDILTGIHATVTGAKSSPTSPANAQTETMNEVEAAAQIDTVRSSHDGTFIFKLVPPRAGLSRAVNFTKPAVHYFAVDNIKQGRLWMAALMKATIQLDSSKSVVTTYGQKTISLEKAKAMRQRPPNLQDADEAIGVLPPETDEEGGDGGEAEDGSATNGAIDDSGLNIRGLNLSYEYIASEAGKVSSTNGEPDGIEGGLASAPLRGVRQSTPTRDAMNSLRLVRSLSGGISNRSRREGEEGDEEGGDDDHLSRASTNASWRTPRNRTRAASGATATTSGSIDAKFAAAKAASLAMGRND